MSYEILLMASIILLLLVLKHLVFSHLSLCFFGTDARLTVLEPLHAPVLNLIQALKFFHDVHKIY